MDLMALTVRRVIAPLWARWEGSPYLRCYGALQCTQYDHPDTIRESQVQAVRELLRHAYDTTSFWQARLDWSGLRPEDVCSFDDFRAVPVLTKGDLRGHAEDMVSNHYNRAALHSRKTSGSTGVSVQAFIDEPA